MDALAGPAGNRDIALFEPQHLSPLNDAGVARGTCGSDRVVRTGDFQIQRDLARRVVRDRSRVVMMAPHVGVVIESFDQKDFVLGFDIAMLGHADINPHPRSIDIFPIQPAVSDRFVRGIHADAARSRATADVFFGLILLRVKVAYAR